MVLLLPSTSFPIITLIHPEDWFRQHDEGDLGEVGQVSIWRQFADRPFLQKRKLKLISSKGRGAFLSLSEFDWRGVGVRCGAINAKV